MSYALLTGFEPYGGRDGNPTTAIVNALTGTRVGNATVRGAILPVAAQRIGARIDEVLDNDLSEAPLCVIATGLAPNASSVRIERLAHNVASFAGADNDGELWVDQLIDPSGPSACFSTFDPRAIANRLLRAGIPCQVSSSAGTYLCNMALYLFLAGLQRRGWSAPCGFIHVPYSPEQVAALVRDNALIEADSTGPPPSMSLDVMVDAVRAVLEVCLETTCAPALETEVGESTSA